MNLKGNFDQEVEIQDVVGLADRRGQNVVSVPEPLQRDLKQGDRLGDSGFSSASLDRHVDYHSSPHQGQVGDFPSRFRPEFSTQHA
jgi:hypothetical protein